MEKFTLEEITRIAEKLGVKLDGDPTPEQKAEIANLLLTLLEIESKMFRKSNRKN
jgi:hypothetical protein